MAASAAIGYGSVGTDTYEIDITSIGGCSINLEKGGGVICRSGEKVLNLWHKRKGVPLYG